MIRPVAVAPRTLARRLLPLQIGVALQGLLLWVPIEKLFMTQIGFDAASVGAMAAAYAAVVPLLEVPSGILADRWSRSRVMILGCLALMISSLVGGLSQNVITYVIAAMILGVYFAFSSGTVDSIVYDTVLEETGSNELYERWIGRIRAVESAAFVLSALAGAAQELADAVIINPYDIDAFAAALSRAINMTADEQVTRMRAMRKVVAGRNVFNWASDILEGLESLWTKPLLYSVRGWEETSV